MQEHVTLLGPHVSTPDTARSSGLPPDLLEQVRGRVRLLALLLLVAFSLDPVLHFVAFAILRLGGQPLPPEFMEELGFSFADLGAAIASGAIWWIARRPSVSPARLHTLGLLYEIVICFVIAVTIYWQWYSQEGQVPPITFVPTILVLWPLIIPGTPRRMLAASVVAGAMAPLALWLLDLWGKVPVAADDYVRSMIGSGFGVGFGYWGGRVVYRLGREVAAARELGSYRLEERLGAGGMGEVWRARHRMLARPAAIKLIRPSSAGISQLAQRRFEQEAQAIARLRSPHTVELFDFGIADDGAFYYVMELLEGMDLDALVRRHGTLRPGRAIYLLRQICHSLIEAQACGLVHRDIKPANIFLCRYGEDYDFVKVLDFGLVKALDHAAERGAGLTAENVVQGTPAFIAPEQALGEDVVDGRTDIYATGCVAYWMLTGQHVFTADTTMGILVHHARTPPVPPSGRTKMPVPPALEHVILACLAKDPADRPQSARELSLLLGAIECGDFWDDDRAREWWAAHGPSAGLTGRPA